MSRQEIKDLVNREWVGQGNQVDIGNVLARVVDAVLDLIPEANGSLVWDMTSLGEISEETTIPLDILKRYNGQQILRTKLNGDTLSLVFTEATEEYLEYSDGQYLALWVYLDGKIKPAE